MKYLPLALLMLVASPAAAQSGGPVLGVPGDHVVQPDKGWVQSIFAGPICDQFLMYPSGRMWAIERGTPMHDGVLVAAQSNYFAWMIYRIAPQLWPTPPTVVVSASTSPPLPGSAHPGYDQVPVFQHSQVVCGSAVVPYAHDEDSAIAILPGSEY